MKISIAMATYNGKAFLKEQLDSFLRQDRWPDEVVISDDGSTDGTLNILEAFRASAPFEVRLLRDQQNLGYAGNFNRALEATNGDLVFLSDQDDVWFHGKVERLEQFARENPKAQVLMCDAELTDGNLNPLHLTKLGQIRSARLPESSFVMGCCAAIRRNFLELTLPIPTAYRAHDNWLVGIADGIGVKAVLDEPLQYYRRHGDNKSDFIANSTRPITPKDLFLKRLKGLLHSRGTEGELIAELAEERLLREGVKRAEARAEGETKENFGALREKVGQRIEFLEARARIRRSPLFQRVPYALSLWSQGGYENASGYKSALVDVLLGDRS